MFVALKKSGFNIPAKYIILADQAMVSGTGFLTNLLVLKLCGLQVFGIFGAWMLVQVFVFTLQYAAISQPMQTVITVQSINKIGTYISSLLLLQILFLLIAVAGIYIYTQVSLADPGPIGGFITMLTTVSLQDSIRKLLIALNFSLQAAISDFISSTLQLLIFALWLTTDGPISLNQIFLAMGTTTIPAIVYGLSFLHPRKIKYTNLKGVASLHYKQAKWLLPGAAVQWASSNLLLVFISFISDKSLLGALRFAQTIMGLFNVALQALENFALPRLSSALSKGSDAYHDCYQKLQKQLLYYFTPLLISLALVIIWLPLPRGWEELGQHRNLFLWCILLYSLIMLIYPLRFAARLVASSRFYFKAYLISAVVSAASGKWLILQFGATGVVFGWLLSQLVLLVYWRFVINVNKKLTTI